MSILQSQLSDDVLEQLGQQIGADKQQTAQAANGVMTSLLGGLANNASQEGGLSSLLGALDRNHDGSVLDDVMGLIGSGGQGAGAADGMGILGHVLGGNQEVVAQQVSERSGLDMSQVMKLMPILAPIVMGALGKMRSQGGLSLEDLPGLLMGTAQNSAQNSGMGDLLGSVLGNVLGGGNNNKGGLGGLLGGLFK